MGRRPKGSWPGTPSEKRDRDRVVELVKRVGKHSLTFTTADIRREMERTKRLGLEHSAELWRHLYALDGSLIEEVGRRDFGSDRAVRPKKKYCLRSRLVDLDRADDGTLTALTDPERVHYAVWVAFVVAGRKPVPTAAVTAVLKNVRDLTLTNGGATHGRLAPLADRSEPLIEKLGEPGHCRWQPLGDMPDHLSFDDWIEEFSRAADQDLVKLGKGTVSEIARDLVTLAVKRSTSTTYRHGRVVSLGDVRRVAGDVEEAKEMAASIRRRASSMGQVIVDASRPVLDGSERVNVRIARVQAPLSGRVFYDVPDLPGFELRRLTLALQDIRHALQDGILDSIRADIQEAQRLPASYPEAGSELSAVIAARTVLAQREFDRLDTVLSGIEDEKPSFTKTIRDEITRHRHKLNTFVSHGIGTGAEAEEIEDLSADLDVSPKSILGAERPLLLADEYMALFPEQDRGSYTPAQFVHLATTVRRFVNPNYTYRGDADRTKRYPQMPDRVEAIAYAAEKQMARSAAVLAAGQQLLGRNLRSIELTRMLTESADAALRRDAMAALALLGDRSTVIRVGLRFLRAAGTPADAVEAALQVLHLVGGPDPKTFPDHVKKHRNRYVKATLRKVVLARHHGIRMV